MTYWMNRLSIQAVRTVCGLRNGRRLNISDQSRTFWHKTSCNTNSHYGTVRLLLYPCCERHQCEYAESEVEHKRGGNDGQSNISHYATRVGFPRFIRHPRIRRLISQAFGLCSVISRPLKEKDFSVGNEVIANNIRGYATRSFLTEQDLIWPLNGGWSCSNNRGPSSKIHEWTLQYNNRLTIVRPGEAHAHFWWTLTKTQLPWCLQDVLC